MQDGASDLLWALQKLLAGGGGQDGSVAPLTELQGHGQTRHHLDPQLHEAHFVVHHRDGLLGQYCV